MPHHRTAHRRAALAGIACALVTAACSTGGPVAAAPASGPAPTSVPSAAASTPAGGTGSTPVATEPADPGGPPRCTTAELTGSLVGGEGAAGTVHRTLVLTNTGSRTCELRGFPGVSYVTGDDGHQVGPAAEMVGDRGGRVDLVPGAAAGTDVGMVNAGNFDPAVCEPTPVRGLRVYPPGETASLFVPAEGTGCAGTPPGQQLTVQTLTAR